MKTSEQQSSSWFQEQWDYVFGRVATLDERIRETKKKLESLREEYDDKCEEILHDQRQLEKKMNQAAEKQNEKELKMYARSFVRLDREHNEYSKQVEQTSNFIVEVDKLKTDAAFNDAFMSLSRIMDMPLLANNGQILHAVTRLKKQQEARKVMREEIKDAVRLESEEEDEEDEEANQRVRELVNEKLRNAQAILIEKLPMIRPMELSVNSTKHENPELIARKVEQFLAKK